MTPLALFTDPLLRAPLLGSILMSFAVSLVGVLVFVRKRSLVGEALSHATYPGVTLAVLIAGALSIEGYAPFMIMGGAFLSALLGYGALLLFERKLKMSNDAALCTVLALFFGIGVTIASYTQQLHARLFRQIEAYLYGQAATMSDHYIWIYATLVITIVATLFLFYKEIVTVSFDRGYASVCGLKAGLVDAITVVLSVLAIVIGIRSVGVILISAMLIAPAVSARQFTHNFPQMFVLAPLFGMISAYFGTYLSFIFRLPMGPAIVLVGGVIAFYALLFAPHRGLLIRYVRILRFRLQQRRENTLKALWHSQERGKHLFTSREIKRVSGLSFLSLPPLLFKFRWRGWIKKREGGYSLTDEGSRKGGQIVRLHRLWEAYLVHSLGVHAAFVHKSAEEMEHILTPELEQQLTELLDNPKQDPHNQPIPSQEVMSHG